jgi:hypothetical protein
VFKMDSMKMDERKRFKSLDFSNKWTISMDWMNWFENGKMIEKHTKVRQWRWWSMENEFTLRNREKWTIFNRRGINGTQDGIHFKMVNENEVGRW